jgi:hypothetical protein
MIVMSADAPVDARRRARASENGSTGVAPNVFLSWPKGFPEA